MTAKLLATLSIHDVVNEAQIGSRLLRLARSAPSRAADAEVEITRLGKEIEAGVSQLEKPLAKAAELAQIGVELATLTAEIEAEQTAPTQACDLPSQAAKTVHEGRHQMSGRTL